MLAATTIEPAPDVAYYAMWSRAPAAGYLDHPGAVAWPLIPVPTHGLAAAIRVLPVMVALGHVWIVAACLHRVRAHATVATALFCAPLWIGGALLWTPDVPLLLAWHIGLLVLLAELDDAPTALPALVPLAMLAAASKVVGWWLVALWVVGAWHRPRTRPWTIASLAAALGVTALTGLDSIAFQLARTTGVAAGRSAWSHVAGPLEVLGGQLAIGGPALLVTIAVVRWRSRRAPSNRTPETGARLRLLAVLAAGAAAPFIVASVVTRVEPNWLAPIWLPLLMWAWLRGDRARDARLWRLAALGQCALLVALVGWLVLATPTPGDPLVRLRGWRSWSLQFPHADLVLADRYQWSSTLALYLGVREAATFDALEPGAAVRPGALDERVDLDAADTVLFIWTEREPPDGAESRWPTIVGRGAVVTAPTSGAPASTRWELRTR